MTAHVSYPFNIGVDNKTLFSRHTFFLFFFHQNLTSWAHWTMGQKSYKLFKAWFFGTNALIFLLP